VAVVETTAVAVTAAVAVGTKLLHHSGLHISFPLVGFP